MIIQIKNRHNGAVIYEDEGKDIKEVAMKAVSNGINLRGADLRGINGYSESPEVLDEIMRQVFEKMNDLNSGKTKKVSKITCADCGSENVDYLFK